MTLDTMGPFRQQETNRYIGTCIASYSTMEIWQKNTNSSHLTKMSDKMAYISGFTSQNMHATQWCLINCYIIDKKSLQQIGA